MKTQFVWTKTQHKLIPCPPESWQRGRGRNGSKWQRNNYIFIYLPFSGEPLVWIPTKWNKYLPLLFNKCAQSSEGRRCQMHNDVGRQPRLVCAVVLTKRATNFCAMEMKLHWWHMIESCLLSFRQTRLPSSCPTLRHSCFLFCVGFVSSFWMSETAREALHNNQQKQKTVWHDCFLPQVHDAQLAQFTFFDETWLYCSHFVLQLFKGKCKFVGTRPLVFRAISEDSIFTVSKRLTSAFSADHVSKTSLKTKNVGWFFFNYKHTDIFALSFLCLFVAGIRTEIRPGLPWYAFAFH